MLARYHVTFPDIDWRNLVTSCGAEFVSLEPAAGDDGFVLTVNGPAKAVETVSADLDFGPFEAVP